MININQLTKQEIINTELPLWGKTYCVIPNKDIVDTAENSFKAYGLKVLDERFRATFGNQVCTGAYFLDYTKDENYNLVFAFTNSYNKQKRFESGVGVSVSINKRTAEGTEEVKIPIISKVSNWKRKHTGTANIEAYQNIDKQIMDYTSMYDSVMEDLNMMKGSCITKLDFAHMLGEMFIEGIISSSQLNIVHNEFKSPRLFEYVYDKEKDCANLYKVYISICYALMEDHPTTYLKNLSAVHAHCLAYCNKDKIVFEAPETISPVGAKEEYVVYAAEFADNPDTKQILNEDYMDIISDDEKVELTEHYNGEEKVIIEDEPIAKSLLFEENGSDFDVDLLSQAKPFEMPQEEIVPPTIEENDIVVDNEGYHIGQLIEIDGVNYKVKGFAGSLAVCQLS